MSDHKFPWRVLAVPSLIICALSVVQISGCIRSQKQSSSIAGNMPEVKAPLPAPVPYHSPTAIIPSQNNQWLYMVERDQHLVRVIDPENLSSTRVVGTPAHPTGIARNAEGTELYLTASSPHGVLVKYDKELNEIKTVRAGHYPTAPAVSPDGKTIAVCDRYKARVLIYDSDLKLKGEVKCIREAVSAVFSPDGKKLFVANSLPDGPANGDETQANVTVVDPAACKLITNIKLLNGAINLQTMCLSPDQKYLIIPYVSARYQVPTTRIDRGWLAANSIALLDIANDTIYATVPVDDAQLGFTNPWCAMIAPDGKTLCLLAAGSHEMITMPYETLMTRIEERYKAINTPRRGAIKPPPPPEDDLGFIRDFRNRRTLNVLGPRCITFIGNNIYIAGYFSDNLNKIDLTGSQEIPPQNMNYGLPFEKLPLGRRGELYFNDGRLCMQQWLSCITCHPDGRVDGLNWDLQNDGIGNPKNTRGMLYSIYTPPAMSTGIRPDAEYAIRSGVTHIQQHVLSKEEEKEIYPALEQYYRELKPIPSPYLNDDGTMTAAAKRGEKVFEKAGCTVCHFGPYLTDMKQYDVGTLQNELDIEKKFKMDTPTLLEIWRTAPYLHDGRTSSLQDVVTVHNPLMRGNTKDLTPEEVEDLVEYMLSL